MKIHKIAKINKFVSCEVNTMHIVYLPISFKKEIANGTTEISFKLNGKQFPFRAGQYVRITVPQLVSPDHRGNYRDFSIASSPNEKGQLKIAIRNSQSSFKKSLLDSHRGTKVKIVGPFGNLAFPENTKTPVVFIAGGIGITPFFSMINYALEQKDGRSMTLLYSNKSKTDAPYLKELETLSQQNPNFSLKNKFGHIDKKFVTDNIKDLKSVVWFIAGPPAMVSAVKDILADLDVADEKIYTEEFVGYEAGLSKYGLSVVDVPVEAVTSDELFAEVLMRSLNEIALVSRTTPDGTIVYANDNFVKVSKYDRDELIGQDHRILRSGYHPQSFYNGIWESIANGKVWRGEIKNRAKDGTYYWVDAVIAPVIDKGGKIIHYVSVRLVITERKEAERILEEKIKEKTQELIKKQEKLKELDKLKTQFLSITSHELRSPMMPMKAQAQLLLKSYFGKLNEKQKSSLEMILRNTEHLDKLIVDILDVSRIQTGKLKFELSKVQITDCIKKSIENMKIFANEKNIEITTKIVELPELVVDKDRIIQVLNNLINNAIKFTPEKGKVIIETEKQNNNILVKIKDTGIGISEENLKKLFQPFFQIDSTYSRKYKGTGLGLNICKGIIEQHNGKIWVKSKLEKGSIFYFTLPLKAQIK